MRPKLEVKNKNCVKVGRLRKCDSNQKRTENSWVRLVELVQENKKNTKGGDLDKTKNRF